MLTHSRHRHLALPHPRIDAALPTPAPGPCTLLAQFWHRNSIPSRELWLDPLPLRYEHSTSAGLQVRTLKHHPLPPTCTLQSVHSPDRISQDTQPHLPLQYSLIPSACPPQGCYLQVALNCVENGGVLPVEGRHQVVEYQMPDGRLEVGLLSVHIHTHTQLLGNL